MLKHPQCAECQESYFCYFDGTEGAAHKIYCGADLASFEKATSSDMGDIICTLMNKLQDAGAGPISFSTPMNKQKAESAGKNAGENVGDSLGAIIDGEVETNDV